MNSLVIDLVKRSVEMSIEEEVQKGGATMRTCRTGGIVIALAVDRQ
jgi:hypothetical protein